MDILISAIVIAIFATITGGVFHEYLVWIVRGAPLLSGAITGALLGDWTTGAIVGGTIQLLYMGQITVGGVTSYDKCYAGVIATAVTIVSNQTPEIGITLAVSLGTIGLIAGNATMTLNVFFVHMAEKYIEEGKINKIWICNWLLPNLVCIVLYGIPAFFAVYFGATYLESFMANLPAFVMTALHAVGMVLPALGIALMFKAVYKAKFIPFAMFGYVCVAYLHFNIIACTILGVACAILYWTLDLERISEIK